MNSVTKSLHDYESTIKHKKDYMVCEKFLPSIAFYSVFIFPIVFFIISLVCLFLFTTITTEVIMLR